MLQGLLGSPFTAAYPMCESCCPEQTLPTGASSEQRLLEARQCKTPLPRFPSRAEHGRPFPPVQKQQRLADSLCRVPPQSDSAHAAAQQQGQEQKEVDQGGCSASDMEPPPKRSRQDQFDSRHETGDMHSCTCGSGNCTADSLYSDCDDFSVLTRLRRLPLQPRM